MEPSVVLKPFLLRAFCQALFFSTLLFAIVACFYWRSQDLGTALNITDYGSLFIFLILYGVLQWMFQKNSLTKLAKGQPDVPQTQKKAPMQPQETEADRETRKNNEKRLFVHLFSVLQREGRLMDFLQQDLSHFEDDQIGAAVRSIHENCTTIVNRYLSLEPVMKQAEGETVEIAAGFDPHAVKLVGNVVGQPPFRGILRHQGWQLRSIALPKLSEVQNPNIIAPAEVEIQ